MPDTDMPEAVVDKGDAGTCFHPLDKGDAATCFHPADDGDGGICFHPADVGDLTAIDERELLFLQAAR